MNIIINRTRNTLHPISKAIFHVSIDVSSFCWVSDAVVSWHSVFDVSFIHLQDVCENVHPFLQDIWLQIMVILFEEDAGIIMDVLCNVSVVLDETKFNVVVVIVVVVGDIVECEGISIVDWLIISVDETWILTTLVVVIMLDDGIVEDLMIEVSNCKCLAVDVECLTIEDEEDGGDIDVVGMIFEDDDISRNVDDADDEVWDVDEMVSCMMFVDDCSIILVVVERSNKLEDIVGIKVDEDVVGSIEVDENSIKLEDDEIGGSGIGGQRSLVDSR